MRTPDFIRAALWVLEVHHQAAPLSGDASPRSAFLACLETKKTEEKFVLTHNSEGSMRHEDDNYDDNQD